MTRYRMAVETIPSIAGKPPIDHVQPHPSPLGEWVKYEEIVAIIESVKSGLTNGGAINACKAIAAGIG